VSLLVAVSAKGSPGVSTSLLALSLCWPAPVLLVEADPAGSDARAGVLSASVPASGHGVLECALAARRGPVDLHAFCWSLDEGQRVWVLPGLSDPAQLPSLTVAWPFFSRALSGVADRDVLVDAGRVTTEDVPPELLAVADALVVVLRPTLQGVDRAKPLVQRYAEMLRGSRTEVLVMPVGPGPYSHREVAHSFEAGSVGGLPDDGPAATALSEGDMARFSRRPLAREARGLAGGLRERMASRRSDLLGASA
jgi:MinD-like ATPase involved in chromosome partitioning or flagellar assembly